jgi:DNA topoisomerase-2
MEEFFGLRKTLYERRKDYMLAKLLKDFEMLSNKVRFINGIIKEEIKLNNKKRQVVIQMLKAKGFKTVTELDAILGVKQKVTVV